MLKQLLERLGAWWRGDAEIIMLPPTDAHPAILDSLIPASPGTPVWLGRGLMITRRSPMEQAAPGTSPADLWQRLYTEPQDFCHCCHFALLPGERATGICYRCRECACVPDAARHSAMTPAGELNPGAVPGNWSTHSSGSGKKGA